MRGILNLHQRLGQQVYRFGQSLIQQWQEIGPPGDAVDLPGAVGYPA